MKRIVAYVKPQRVRCLDDSGAEYLVDNLLRCSGHIAIYVKTCWAEPWSTDLAVSFPCRLTLSIKGMAGSDTLTARRSSLPGERYHILALCYSNELRAKVGRAGGQSRRKSEQSHETTYCTSACQVHSAGLTLQNTVAVYRDDVY